MPSITVFLRIISLIIAAGILCSCRHDADSSLPPLRRLDQVLAAPDTLAATRRSRIAELSTDLLSVTSHADRYNIYRGLYGQYRRFRIDSAMLIAEDRLKEARLCGGNRIISASLNLAESYSDMGNYHETLDILDTIPRIGLAVALRLAHRRLENNRRMPIEQLNMSRYKHHDQ